MAAPKKKHRNRKLRVLSLAILILFVMDLILLMVVITKGMNRTHQETADDAAVSGGSISTPVPASDMKTAEPYEISEEKIQQLRTDLSTDQDINPEVRGIISFNSGLLEDPILQTDNNTKYDRADWQTMEYQSYGSIWMDYENSGDFTDQNTVIYGHYIYRFKNKDRTLVFTPLEQLMHEENYEANRYLSVVTRDGIRYYEVVMAVNCPLKEVQGGQTTYENMQYNLSSYEEDYFNTMISEMHANEFYDTGKTLEFSDHWLTLQTCIEGYENYRELVFCRELKTIPFHN